jgi:hypothetical protein
VSRVLSLPLLALGVLTCCATSTRADDKQTTVTYDVADLVRDASTWRSALAGQPGERDPDSRAGAIEALVGLIQRSVNPKSWRPGKEGSCTLRIFNGTKLVIQAPAKQHDEIKDLLKALRRLTGIAVVFESELHEVEPAYYKKNIEPLLKGGPARPDRGFAVFAKEAVEAGLRKQGKPLHWAKVTAPLGKETAFFSLRTVFTYQARPKRGKRPADEDYASAFYGVTFRAHVRVSADRRFVRLKLTQKVTDLLGVEQETILDRATGERVNVEVPKLFESATKGTIEIGDGGLLLMPVRYRSREAKDKGRFWVLLVRPIIYIEEEERARRNNAK